MPKQTLVEIPTSPVESAKAAGLRYVTDTSPGIQRKRQGKGFQYLNSDGSTVRDKEVLARIKSLVIPPAWTNVWICSNPKGHLQATGRDARKRNQSRYHPRWREIRDETKYHRMMIFGSQLPKIRERVERDLTVNGLPREKILATVVRLMELTHIRVGNEEYARQNHSYGLTTMRGRHVDVDGQTLTFKFKGKSGKRHVIDVSDRRLAKIVQRCQDLPGHELFQYIDEDGEYRAVDSADVNEYLGEICNESFTAKDFRTWAGTLMACRELRKFEAFDSETQAKKNIVQAIAAVAERLGNTPSVCRKCYVHPRVIEGYLGGEVFGAARTTLEDELGTTPHALRKEEIALIKLIQSLAALASA